MDDITERKRAENALRAAHDTLEQRVRERTVELEREIAEHERTGAKFRESKEQFKNFTEAASDWFWEQDADLRFTAASPEVYEKSGVTAADHVGKTRRDIVSLGVTEEQWRQHEADLAARRPFRDFTFQRRDPSGKPRDFSVSGKPVFDAEGRFKGRAFLKRQCGFLRETANDREGVCVMGPPTTLQYSVQNVFPAVHRATDYHRMFAVLSVWLAVAVGALMLINDARAVPLERGTHGTTSADSSRSDRLSDQPIQLADMRRSRSRVGSSIRRSLTGTSVKRTIRAVSKQTQSRVQRMDENLKKNKPEVDARMVPLPRDSNPVEESLYSSEREYF